MRTSKFYFEILFGQKYKCHTVHALIFLASAKYQLQYYAHRLHQSIQQYTNNLTLMQKLFKFNDNKLNVSTRP